MQSNPLSQGNWLQRRYHAWAAPHYARMAPAVREQVELIDGFLYSRRGLWVWLGMVCALAAATWGLTAAGFPLALALSLGLIAFAGLPMGALGAWLQPERFAARRLRKTVPLIFAMGFLGAFFGFVIGHVSKHGGLDPVRLLHSLWDALSLIAPIVLLAMAGMMALMWGVAQVRRQVMERELERVTLAGERDSAARQAAEARLQLLNAQIRPHFLFNTLSALQHWVDSADARAGPLLRSLTAFLRGSTELLGRDEVQLADEAAMAGQYLSILQSRLGPRLGYKIDIAPQVALQALPPGLLLTLVENAVEHGISPSLTGGEVRVEAARDEAGWWLRVSDDGAGLPDGWHDGVGLSNCRKRLAHCFGDRAVLTLTALRPGTESLLCIAEGAP